MRYVIAIAALCFIGGCAHTSVFPRYVEGPCGLTLPSAAKHPKIKGGMTVAEVKRILPPGTFVDDAFDLRLPVLDDSKKEVIGYHNVEWLDGYVNKIHFYRGKDLDHIEGIWLLSECEKEDNN